MPGVIAFSSVCEEDVHRWIPQYLAEAERLGIGFVMHFDRCSFDSIKWITSHHLCQRFTVHPDTSIEFTEQHKQGIFDKLAECDADWAMAWDVDETWEKHAPEKLRTELHPMINSVDCIDCPHLNLWDSPDRIRIDGPLRYSHRIKFYNLRRISKWRFDHPITNGCKPLDGRAAVISSWNLACLHWGNMLPEDRFKKKDRWDRIYTKAVGANPYGFWDYVSNPSIEPICVQNEYLP